ncbi:Vps52/Sac2 [Carpediemonas membranifera]|uniref:Vps52/Sac2 n=1 Tax=Carpediemonas membranifera TaxID=201153 RepID=A0A8J6AS73_9EUKA|nr:Vps52/Sac2 [Carpediemonas membranifera]|eukprot:KAG9393106.1 Vps52/Sac2 [Carpediemonas membranifera]
MDEKLLNPQAEKVKQELLAEEESLIDVFVEQQETAESVVVELRECDEVLDKMEKSFGSFQQSITALYRDIRHLQDESSLLRVQLSNRQAVAGEIAEYVSKCELSTGTIKLLLEGSINRQYHEALGELSDRLTFLSSLDAVRAHPGALKAYSDQIDVLSIAVAKRLQSFLSRLIVSLRRAEGRADRGTDIAPHAPVLSFLHLHCAPVATLITSLYEDVMSKVYLSSFTSYLKSINPDADPVGLIGDTGTIWKRGRVGLSNIAESLSLDGRRSILTTASTRASIAPAPTLTVERAAISVVQLLGEVALTESAFDWDFFSGREPAMAGKILAKPIDAVVETVGRWMDKTTDAVGLMAALVAVHAVRSRMERHGVGVLTSAMQRLDMLGIPHFMALIDRHIASLPERLDADGGINQVTHRFGKLLASILAVNVVYPELCPHAPRKLSDAFNRCIMATQVKGKPEGRLAFLASSYYHILGELRHVDGGDVKASYANQLRSCVEAYGQLAANALCPAVFSFVASVDAVVGHDGSYSEFVKESEEAPGNISIALEKAVRAFAAQWEAGVQTMATQVAGQLCGGAEGLAFKAAFSSLNRLNARLGSLVQGSPQNLIRLTVPASKLSAAKDDILAKRGW